MRGEKFASEVSLEQLSEAQAQSRIPMTLEDKVKQM